jgi:hypothetical protein
MGFTVVLGYKSAESVDFGINEKAIPNYGFEA